MGFRKVPTIHTLQFDGDYEGLVVRMKSTPLGKIRKLINLLNEDDEGDGFGAVDAIVALLADHLVSWNMEDEDGEPVPADEEGLNAQDLDFVMDLSNRYLAGITGPSEELGKGSTAGAPFPGRPLTMEVL